MERASDGRVLVVADASVLINFLRAGRLDLLRHHEGYKIVVTEHARREVTYADQAPDLAAALTAGDIDGIQVTDLVELRLFAELNAVLGRGESASIAVAANRGWVIAMDELGRARREVYERVGRNRLINTPGLILSCIRNGDLQQFAEELNVREAERFRVLNRQPSAGFMRLNEATDQLFREML